ncbi:MAG: hypothetical protein AAF724_14145 [Pseudomonadota bacterium]
MSLISSVSDCKSDAMNIASLVTPGRVGIMLGAIIAVMVALWPFGLTSDYINHLARNYIEGHIWFDSDLQNFYALSFSVIPDLTMDMIVPWLSHITGIYAAGAVTVWIAFVAPPLAGLLIARNLFGRVTWFSLAGFLVVFNTNMQWGFVNFTASTGIALLGFALWMNWGPHWRRTLLFIPFCAFLALNHALGFLLFGYLVLLWELACFARGERGTRWSFVLQLATKDALAMLPGLLVLVLATGNSQQLTHVGVADFDLLQKIAALWSGAEFFNPLLGIVITFAAIMAVYMGLRGRVVSIEPRMAGVCAGMLFLVLAMPTSILGIWGLHFRYPAVLVILVAASLHMNTDLGKSRIRLAAIAVSALLLAGFANATFQMQSIDRQTRELSALLSGLPQSARLLPARSADAELSFALHSAAMAVIERSAYVPNLFTNTSPVDVHPKMLAQHMPQAWPLLEEQLLSTRDLTLPAPGNGHWSRSYYYGWPKHWDYVIYFRTAANQALQIDGLCKVDEREAFALYRISHAQCAEVGGLENAALRPALRK